MRRRIWAILLAGGASLALASASAAQADSVTATGASQHAVHPSDRHNNASIARAYDAARQAAIGGALRQAHEYAVAYAKAVGLRLGSVSSVSDAQNGGYYGPGQFFGPFGPDQFCGTVRQPIVKKKNGKRKVVGTKKVHRCIVPSSAYVTLTVTYSAS